VDKCYKYIYYIDYEQTLMGRSHPALSISSTLGAQRLAIIRHQQ